MTNSKKQLNYFITGVSSGIGAELTRQLVDDGHNVFGTGRRIAELLALQSELITCTGKFDFEIGDVLDNGFLEQAKIRFEQKFGGEIDVLIPNAGYVCRGNFTELGAADYKHQLDVNLNSVIRLVDLFMDNIKSNKGQIVFMGSMFATRSLPGFSAYTISKVGIKALAEGLFYELQDSGVAVTLITPGFITSDIRNRGSRGIYTQQKLEQTPQFLEVDTKKAVSVMLKGIKKKKREQVVGFHAVLLIFIMKYFPFPFIFDGCYRLYLSKLSRSAESSEKQ